MNKRGVVPMESYRLAQYTVQVPCYICEEGNNFDSELCRRCQAPMALAHQASTQKVHPNMVAVLGSAGAGKTVYLGMLTDMLSRQDERLQLLARGAFSINLQQNTTDSLLRCEFPDKTPNEPDRWSWIHCQVQAQTQKRPIELIMPDIAGEALMEEIDHPYSYPVIRSFLSKCSGVLALVDASEIEEGEHTQDFFIMKIISYLCELDNSRKTGWHNRPISFVFTKADQCSSCFTDPRKFAQAHTPGLWRQCQERIQRHEFFASGVAGACAYRSEFGVRVPVPLRIEPRGIIEPFAWLVDQIAK